MNVWTGTGVAPGRASRSCPECLDTTAKEPGYTTNYYVLDYRWEGAERAREERGKAKAAHEIGRACRYEGKGRYERAGRHAGTQAGKLASRQVGRSSITPWHYAIHDLRNIPPTLVWGQNIGRVAVVLHHGAWAMRRHQPWWAAQGLLATRRCSEEARQLTDGFQKS